MGKTLTQFKAVGHVRESVVLGGLNRSGRSGQRLGCRARDLVMLKVLQSPA